MNDFFALYDALLEGVPDLPVLNTQSGDFWTGVETREGLGLAMTTPGDTAPRMLPQFDDSLSLKELSQGVKSWNFTEAGYSMAAINARYNTEVRLHQLQAQEPFEHYCTRGLNLSGKRIGVVGHLNMPEFIRREAKEVWILERNPQPGDYPDSACEVLLPQCDVVLITASTLVNKTLPRLLALCANAYTILTGPTCPMCPALLDMGIDRLAGLVVTNRPGMKEKIAANLPGPPYPLGQPFLLTREHL